jgi:hypothetical protein
MSSWSRAWARRSCRATTPAAPLAASWRGRQRAASINGGMAAAGTHLILAAKRGGGRSGGGAVNKLQHGCDLQAIAHPPLAPVGLLWSLPLRAPGPPPAPPRPPAPRQWATRPPLAATGWAAGCLAPSCGRWEGTGPRKRTRRMGPPAGARRRRRRWTSCAAACGWWPIPARATCCWRRRRAQAP